MSTRRAPSRLWSGPSPVLLEVGVVTLLAGTAYGFVRLFDSVGVVVPLLAAVAGSQVLNMAGRRLRLPTPLIALVSLAALTVVVANWATPGTTVRFLPTRATGPALLEVARAGMVAFEDVRAPVPPLLPFVLGAFVALWVTTFLTDWAALRLRLAVETVLPAGALFVFCALLGSGQHQVSATAAFAGGVASYAVLQRVVNQSQRATWLAVERARGLRTAATSALALAAVAVLAGLAVGPRLPGAGSEELWSWRGRGEGTRVVVSPYVTIESRLVEQADTELFRVTASEPAYWRTAGLDLYQDGVWQIRGRFSRQDGHLPGDGAPTGAFDVVDQRFELTGLAEIWLPAAYAPSRILEADGAVTWNEDTSTLSVDRDRSVNTGAVYSLQSAVPRFTEDQLRAADSTEVPVPLAEAFLALPSDLTPAVAEEARRVTAGKTNRYDQLRALQDWFHAEFTYGTDLGPRRGDPIEQFLAERVGFCQQFAGTFALMARALGAPARVAVGFTWGDRDPEDPNTYTVTGRHAHAWPEVWFPGLGWVPFEPTPGRGAPESEAWTGVEANQDGAGEEELAGSSLPGEQPSAGETPVPTPEGMFPEEFLADLGSGEAATGGGAEGNGPGVLRSTPKPVLAGLGLVASWMIGVPLVDEVARARRRARSRTPAERVHLAWRRATEELAVLGLLRQPSETRLEFSQRVSRDRRVRCDAPVDLAQLATVARFHPSGVDDLAVRSAEHQLGVLSGLVHKRVPAWKRYLRRVDPRRRLSRSAR